MNNQECIGLPNQDGNTVLRSLPPAHIRLIDTNQVLSLDPLTSFYFDNKGEAFCGSYWLLGNMEKWICSINS
jgi:hypothetical protein